MLRQQTELEFGEDYGNGFQLYYDIISIIINNCNFVTFLSLVKNIKWLYNYKKLGG